MADVSRINVSGGEGIAVYVCSAVLRTFLLGTFLRQMSLQWYKDPCKFMGCFAIPNLIATPNCSALTAFCAELQKGELQVNCLLACCAEIHWNDSIATSSFWF